ncbi:flagellar hook-associated protein FlgK [Sphingosinicella sp. LHD-64]|uniref:flagellar hook-associated protein FlgK n=1 Tax=Sphingosinicella sp. LHD-64 TaxID=3072139 RepID=UPI00280CD3E4|nr:flagellar hook-associated protein FlgK [Sphingosinicella sp. LHD-64]MDQ8757192.1 flagellar hook-associated protein FlgK [Sphingosinicella sp. LHD-64]
MSDLLSIGSSGLAAYRSALNAIGENVSNAETPGFSRRNVRLEQLSLTGNGEIGYREQVMFNGVRTAGVERAWDAFRATEARLATSAAGRAGVREQWLTGVETALGDGPAGIGSSLTRFFNGATSLAADPSDRLGRSSMLAALEDVAVGFRNTADALARVSTGMKEAAGLDVNAVNSALRALQDINGTIRTAGPGTSARAGLEDERDKLIGMIAERLDINVTTNGDGTVAISAASDGSVKLLDGQGPGLISLVPAADGRLSYQLSKDGTTAPLPTLAGKLAGLAETASSTADRRSALDAMAADFVSLVNTWSAGGTDANGNPGGNLLEAPTGAVSMRALVTDPDLVAAAGGGTANGNLAALDGLRTSSGIENRWGDLVSDNAQVLASAKAEASAANSWRDLSRASLDGVTGVDLDYEAAELLRFQQAYNASARIVQVARETIEALFNAL